MKLLIYSHFFAPSVGGVETIVLSLARGLAERRTTCGNAEFEVTVATQTPVGDFQDDALPFTVVRQPSLRQLWRLVRECDVLHAAGPALPPLVLAWLARKPAVIEHHGYQAICPNGLLVHQPDATVCPGHFQAGNYGECLRCLSCETSAWQSFAMLLLQFPRRWLARGASLNIAVSDHVLKREGLPRSAVIYHGIDELRPSEFAVTERASAQSKICFAYVGRLVSEKGVATLLRAANKLKKDGFAFDLRIIGDGPQRPQLAAFIHEHQLENCVRITGYLAGRALEDCLQDVQVIIAPSICEETAGLAAMEQMMRGRAVIASDIGGLSEIVGDAGVKFTPGDFEALAENMKRVFQTPSVVESLGAAAKSRALKLFRRDRMITEHATAYVAALRP
ncbi:MAG TPA: glycosyltransferase family 4 protein [Candidatus Acidoferrum sp.]